MHVHLAYVQVCGLERKGGLTASGRWHTHPKAVVYCADEAPVAYSEILRQVGHASLLPDEYKMLKIEISDNLLVDELDVHLLDARWSDRVVGWSICQPIGDAWLAATSASLLKVPSVVRSGACNYLINPAHADAQYIKIVEIIPQPLSASITTF